MVCESNVYYSIYGSSHGVIIIIRGQDKAGQDRAGERTKVGRMNDVDVRMRGNKGDKSCG